MNKRLTVLLYAVCLMVGTFFCPVEEAAVYAEEGETGDIEKESGDYIYRITEMETAEIQKYTGTDKDLVIPDKLDGLNVTGIVRDAILESCRTLESVTIPGSMRSIEDGIFVTCPALKEIKVASGNDRYFSIDGVLYDSYDQFEEGKATMISCPPGKSGEICLPESVGRIGISAFMNCFYLTAIEVDAKNNWFSSEDGILYDKAKEEVISCPRGKTGEIHLPKGVEQIRDQAFYRCQKLTKIEIPPSVWVIDSFEFCKSLENIVVDPDNRNYCSENGILYDLRRTVLLTYPGGRKEGSVLPESITSIADAAFCGGSVTDIELPKYVASIGSGAFFGCSDLESVKLPKSLKNIQNQAFWGCENLKNVFYEGSEEEWREISIGSGNESLTGAQIHYNYCEHIYESIVTAAPTCTGAGIKTFTCTKCGDTYTEEIAKISHNYENGTCSICGQADQAASNHVSQAEPLTVPTPKISVCKNTKGKKITLKWKKVSKASGYQIQYSVNKKFKNAATKSTKKNSFTIRKLKKGKKYYVRIQAYRTVSGERYDSAWSKVKHVKIVK